MCLLQPKLIPLLQPPFISRKHTHLGTLTHTNGQSNGEAIHRFQPVNLSRKTTLWSFIILCVTFVALLMKFVALDVFTSSRLPMTFTTTLGPYDIEVFVMRRAHPVLSPLGPLLEYASQSAGGRTIDALTSATYSPPSSGRYVFVSRKGAPREVQTPTLALTDGMEPGQCWAFNGDAGQLGIQLADPIHVSHLTLGYPSISRATSAPKTLILWGLKPADSEVCATLGDIGTPSPDFGSKYCGIRLLSGIYKPEFSMPTYYQNFTATGVSYDHYFDRMIFQVLGNWGHKDFTCIYRIWIYGRAQ
jgi:hypothetical protein